MEISIFGDNLYPPVLGEEEYTTSVNENTSPPKVLFTVTATDQDTMYFGEVYFVHFIHFVHFARLTTFYINFIVVIVNEFLKF